MSDAGAPLKPEDMNRFAGQWVEAKSPMFGLLPPDRPMILGTKNPRDYSLHRECFVCRGPVFLHPRDGRVLSEFPDITVLCPDCYFKMEPAEI